MRGRSEGLEVSGSVGERLAPGGLMQPVDPAPWLRSPSDSLPASLIVLDAGDAAASPHPSAALGVATSWLEANAPVIRSFLRPGSCGVGRHPPACMLLPPSLSTTRRLTAGALPAGEDGEGGAGEGARRALRSETRSLTVGAGSPASVAPPCSPPAPASFPPTAAPAAIGSAAPELCPVAGAAARIDSRASAVPSSPAHSAPGRASSFGSPSRSITSLTSACAPRFASRRTPTVSPFASSASAVTAGIASGVR
mmetsp:Transcript_1092/g.2259  ORF Transcript_1092/g.2259 Transcript_1092/m.2259 type:complete len:253 (-) Transcript_1092:188-946(-)